MIRDLNPDFWIQICQIAAKMLWIRYVVGIGRFTVLWKSAGDCVRNANKSYKIPYSAMVREV